MYVSAWPGLSPAQLFPRRAEQPLPYPLSAPRRNSFYVARSGIYHLFRSLGLRSDEPVMAPDYYSGNEVGAMEAAGASLVHYPIRRNLEPDLDALVRLMREVRPRVLYAIHYLGWPQPVAEMAALAKHHGCILIEDCALAMLSEPHGFPLGAHGDYSIFCLYKTLPVPNGGLVVQNRMNLPEVRPGEMTGCPPLGALGRSAELLLESLRSRCDRIGGALFAAKRAVGWALRAASVRHVPVGDIGWQLGNANVAMSSISDRVMGSLDFQAIRARRRDNFLHLRERLQGRVRMVREDLAEGICPLFFPILVRHKHAAAQALQSRGVGAVEFWNDRQDNPIIGPDARYLRAHVLELPIHQGVDAPQVEYIADQVVELNLEAAPC